MTTTETFTGNDATGSDGAINRVLTIANTSITENDDFQVYVNNAFLHISVDYNVTHKSTNTTITFLNNLWDNQQIAVVYTAPLVAPTGTASAIGIVGDFQDATASLMTYGQQVRFRYFHVAYDADYYDDDVTLTRSGTDFWTSGVILPINNARGSDDAVLLEQGKILMNDTKLYITGTVNTSGTWKLGLGNPIEGEYSLLSEGTKKWNVNQIPIMKKLFVRKLLTGSMIGESET